MGSHSTNPNNLRGARKRWAKSPMAFHREARFETLMLHFPLGMATLYFVASSMTLIFSSCCTCLVGSSLFLWLYEVNLFLGPKAELFAISFFFGLILIYFPLFSHLCRSESSYSGWINLNTITDNWISNVMDFCNTYKTIFISCYIK